MLLVEISQKSVVPASYESLDFQSKSNLDSFIDDLINEAYSNGKPFNVSMLVGKKNFETWKGTPLYPIYEYNTSNHTRDAVIQSGIDIGFIIKDRIIKSLHTFKLVKKYTNEYIPL